MTTQSITALPSTRQIERHPEMPPAPKPTRPSAPHYTQGAIESIDAIRAALTPEEFRGYCKGNVLKYTWRERHKGGGDDLRKAADYLRFLQEM